MQKDKGLITKVLGLHLPIKFRRGNLYISARSETSLHKILNCISSKGDYKDFKSMSTWKTIAGFGGTNNEIFVKITIFKKIKDRLRASFLIPQIKYGYRYAVGESYNLIMAEKRKLNTPKVLGLIKRKRFFLDHEHHLIIESLPTSISLNTAILRKTIPLEIAFDILKAAINELYNAEAIHLDFHLENIIINTKNPLDYKIIDLEFFDFLKKPLNKTIPWHLAQLFQNRGEQIIEMHIMNSFAEKLIANYSKDQHESTSLYEDYNNWKTSSLKHERFWYENE